MWGGEDSGARSIHWQHHPATLHWRRPDGAVGWLKLATPAPVDASADAGGLSAVVHAGIPWLRESAVPVWLELSHEPAAPLELRDGAVWDLAGLALRVGVSARVLARREPRRAGTSFEPGRAPRTLELRLAVESTPSARR
jgi:hypothetical protein